MANPNFDQYLTTTLDNHRPQPIDNIFGARALAYWLKESGSVKISGGQKIVRPVNFSKNATAGSYAGADTLNIGASPGPTAAEYDWKQHAVSVYIEGIEEARNAGEAQIIDLLSYRVEQAMETAMDDFNTMWWGDGTGNTGKDMNGLANLVGQNAAAVGNIDPTVETNWQTTAVATVGALTEAKMRTPFNTASVGADKPTVIVAPQDLYEAYEGLLTPDRRYEDVAMANAGFQTLTFKGVPVVYDEDCPAGEIFGLNTRYIEAVFHQDKMLTPTPFVRPEDKDLRVSQLLTYGNLTIKNRKRQFHMSGVTAA